MKPNLLAVAFALHTLGPVAVAAAQDKAALSDRKLEEKRAQILGLLETQIDTKVFRKVMPLGKFLAAVEAALPEGKRVALRLDEEALGKDLPGVAGTPIRIPVLPRKISVHTALRYALARVALGDEMDPLEYAVRPPGVVITRARLAAYTAVHDIRDVVEQLPLLPDLKQLHGELFQGPE